MKKFFIFLSFSGFGLLSAQQLSDFHFIYVPKNFTDFADNKFNIHSTLIKDLQNKGYEVLQNEKSEWPNSAQQNPCEIATADISNTSSLFRNKLTLTIKNCNGEILFAEKGDSNEKDYELGFQEALKNIMNKVAVSAPSTKMEKVVVAQSPSKKTDVNQEQSQTNTIKSDKKLDSATPQTYTFKTMVLRKIKISDNEFIFISDLSETPVARFKNSSKEGVFRVILSDGSAAIGFAEGENFALDLPTENGNYKKEIIHLNYN